MAKEKWISIRTYGNAAEATELMALFKAQNLDYIVREDDMRSWTGHDFVTGLNTVSVCVRESDAEIAENFASELKEEKSESLEEQNYFQDYSDEQLLDVLKNPDQWGSVFTENAEATLKSRGIIIEPEQKQEFYDKKLKESRQTEEIAPDFTIKALFLTVFAGLIVLYFSEKWFDYLFIPTFTESLGGIFTGYYFWSDKKPDMEGNLLYRYSPKSRKNGLYLMIFFAALTPLIFLYDFLF